MKKELKRTFSFVLIISLAFLFSCSNAGDPVNFENSVIVCGDSKIIIVEYPEDSDTVPKIIWQWDANYANDLPFEYRTRRFNSIDDCKAAPGGEKLLISSSSGAVAVLNIKGKKVEFLAEVPNAHSIEMLPGNMIAAAASTTPKGNKLMLFENTQPAKLLDTDSLYSAHGTVWDKKRDVLWVLGYDVLRQYSITDKKLSKNREWTIPGISGHDLQMAPGKNKLFVSEHNGVWIFDIETESFEKIKGFPDAKDIKSINLNKDGRYVYTVPERSWWTYHVSFHNPKGSLSFPNMRVYKARPFERNN